MKQIVLCLFLLFFLQVNASGSISFSVTTERTRCVLGEQIVITATVVSDKNLKNITAPTLPSSGFYSLLRTSSDQRQSSSIQIINNKMIQTKEITYLFYYHIAFKKEGTFTFPSLEFKFDGKSYKSKAFPITVGKEPVQTQNISVYVRLNKNRIYAGEQCVLTFEVAQKPQAPVNLTSQGFATVIDNLEKSFGKNFSINRLFTNQVSKSQKRIQGVIYLTYSLSFSVIPIKSGSYSIPSVPFEYMELRQAQRRRRSFFDDFFNDPFFGRGIQQVPKTAYSNRLSVNILSLPPQPDDFTGAVGTFSLKASVNAYKIPAGEAVTLNIDLSGSTRPGNVSDIKLPDMPDFEIFSPEKHTYVDTTAKGISTRKKYKYLIIPREEGEKTIQPIAWTYFNPDKGAYKTLSTDPITLTVTKGKKGKKRLARYLTQEDIREVGRDIRYIKMPKQLKHQSTEPHKNPLFIVLFPIPFLIALFALLYRLQATVLKKDPSIILKRRALRKAKVALAKLNKEFSTATPANAVSRIAEIIETYISHRFSFAAIGKTLDELKVELTKLDVDQSVTDTLVPYLEQLDIHRFSGSTPDKKAILELLEKGKLLIEKLERKEKKA